jgi:hypothetical protein
VSKRGEKDVVMEWDNNLEKKWEGVFVNFTVCVEYTAPL